MDWNKGLGAHEKMFPRVGRLYAITLTFDLCTSLVRVEFDRHLA